MGLKNVEARWTRRMFAAASSTSKYQRRHLSYLGPIGRRVRLMCEGRAPNLDVVIGLLWSDTAWAAAWARVRARTYKRSGVLLEAQAPKQRRYKTVFKDDRHEFWGYFDAKDPDRLLPTTNHPGRWRSLEDDRDYAPELTRHTHGAPVSLHVTSII